MNLRGIATGEWAYDFAPKGFTTKVDLLAAFEALREQSLGWWEQITADKLVVCWQVTTEAKANT